MPITPYELENATMSKFTSVWEYTDRLHRSGLSSFPPAIIGCAITGSNHGKEANPNLPETLEEQVRSCEEAYKAGAVMVHLHRRNPQNLAMTSTDPEEYRELNIKVREKCPDIIINDTMAGGYGSDDEGRRVGPHTVSLTAEPEIASLDASTYISYVKLPAREGVRDKAVMRQWMYSISQPEVEWCIQELEKRNIKPEFELFAMTDLYYVKRLLDAGYKDKFGGPLWVNFVFTAGSNWPTAQFVDSVVRNTPDGCLLQISGTGAQQWGVLGQALIQGAHVRVGMEDNVYYRKGVLAESNGQLVEKIVRIANDLDRQVATCEQARKMLGLGAPRTW